MLGCAMTALNSIKELYGLSEKQETKSCSDMIWDLGDGDIEHDD
jgi:hypothetical protein